VYHAAGPRGKLCAMDVRIACARLAPVLGDVERNRRMTLDAIERAAADGAGLVVLPELCSSGYVFADRDQAAAAAEPADGPTVTAWAEAAARLGIVVAGGFAEVSGGDLYNSAALVDAAGVRAVYHKLHLWDREQLVFSAGDAPPPLVSTAAGRIGLGICYDLLFPELTRPLAVAGADVLVFPTASPLLGAAEGPWPMEVAVAATTAYVNRVFVAVADRCGAEPRSRVGGRQRDRRSRRTAAGGAARGRRRPGHGGRGLPPGRGPRQALGERNDVLGDRRGDVLGSV
jgi:predicted amidohydrolase